MDRTDPLEIKPGTSLGKKTTLELSVARFSFEERRPGGKRKGRYRPRYRKRERTLGFTLQTGFAVPRGTTVEAYGLGPMVQGRFNLNLGDAAFITFDLHWSYHAVKNARPLFFRSLETDSSTIGGALQVLTPAAFYGWSIPLGYGYANRARFNPKFYFGVGPDFLISQAFMTESGQKGTVRGEGIQVFLAFIPGLGFDLRLGDHFFLGLDMQYHMTFPIARPPIEDEFTIPRFSLFQLGFTVSYYFY